MQKNIYAKGGNPSFQTYAKHKSLFSSDFSWQQNISKF